MAAQTSRGTRNNKDPKRVKGNKEITQMMTPKLGAKKPGRVKTKSNLQEKVAVQKHSVQQQSTVKEKPNMNNSETEEEGNDAVDVMDASPIL